MLETIFTSISLGLLSSASPCILPLYPGFLAYLAGRQEGIKSRMEHCDSKGRPKLRRQCTYPLTGKACVSYVVTDLALLRWHDGRFVLDEVAPGFAPREVLELAEMEIAVGPNVGTME